MAEPSNAAPEQPKLPIKDKPSSLLGGEQILERPLKRQNNHGLLFWRLAEIAAELSHPETSEDEEKKAELIAEKDHLVEEIRIRLNQVIAAYF